MAEISDTDFLKQQQRSIPGTATTTPVPSDMDYIKQMQGQAQDQVQGNPTNYVEAAKSAGIGAVKGAANVADFVTGPLVQDIRPGTQTFSDVANRYLPEPTNKPAANIAEAGTSGALFGPAGAAIGAASTAGTEVLNKVRPDSPVANVVEPALVSMLFVPGTVNSLLKVGRLSGEGLGIFSRPDLVQAKINQGITAGTAASTTPSDFWRKLQRSSKEGLLENKITSTQELEQQQLESAVNRVAGPDVTTQQAGTAAKAGIEDGITITKRFFNTYENSLDAAVPPKTTYVNIYPFFSRMINELSPEVGTEAQLTRLGLTPEKTHIDPFIEDIIASVNRGGPADSLSIQNIRTVKQAVGDKLTESLMNGDAGVKNLKTVYGILADAQEAGYVNTPYHTSYIQLKKAEAEMYSSIEKFVEPLVAAKLAPEEIAQRLSSGMKLGGTKLQLALDMIDKSSPALKQEYTSMILRNLGKNRQGEFDSNRYFTNWQQISPEAKIAMFGDANRDLPQAYDQLALIAQNQARGAKALNPSQTAGTAEILAMFGKFGAVAGSLAGYETTQKTDVNGDPVARAGIGGVAGGLAAGILGPMIAGKLMTNPSFIRWLATPTALNELPMHMRALAAIAGEAPEIKPQLDAFTIYAHNKLGLGNPIDRNNPRGFLGGGLVDFGNQTNPGYSQGGISHNTDDPRPFYNAQLPRVGYGFASGGVINDNEFTSPRGNILDFFMGQHKPFGGGGPGGPRISNGGTPKQGIMDNTLWDSRPHTWQELDFPASINDSFGIKLPKEWFNNPHGLAQGGYIQNSTMGYAEGGMGSLEGESGAPHQFGAGTEDIANAINNPNDVSLLSKVLGYSEDDTHHSPMSKNREAGQDAYTQEILDTFGGIKEDSQMEPILEYNLNKEPDDTTQLAEGGPTGNRFEEAVDYYKTNAGLTDAQARGAVKYMYVNESKLDPNIVNPTSGAYGVIQALGPRKQALFAEYGNHPDFKQQLAFSVKELFTTHKNVLDRLKQVDTEKQSYDIWGRYYEIPGEAALRKAGVNYNPGEVQVAALKNKSGTNEKQKSLLDHILPQAPSEEPTEEQPLVNDTIEPTIAALDSADWVAPETKYAAHKILRENA